MFERLQVPPVFERTREYRYDHQALEAAQATFNEEGLYESIATLARAWHVQNKRPARVLDLCSATGLTALRVTRAIPVESVVLVDTDSLALKKGLSYLNTLCPVLAVCADAVTFSSSERFDLILMNSAYHHIENERKAQFMRNSLACLEEHGQVLVGEHFLPEYSSHRQFQLSVVRFYTALIERLTAEGESEGAISVIRRAGRYCYEGTYEYKVSWPVFMRHTRDAGYMLCENREIWRPFPESTGNTGSFVALLSRRVS